MVDAAWPDRRLIAELDSYGIHTSRRNFEEDRARDRALTVAGWRVVRITWRQLHHHRATLAAELRRSSPSPHANTQGIGAQADDGASTHGRVRGTAQGRAPLRAPALMELFDTTQLGLQRAIEGAAQRQTALASNLANANTPDFKPKDVDFHSALQRGLRHRRPQGGRGRGLPTTTQTDVMRQDGNGIDVDVESAKMAENGLEYQALVQVAVGRIAILQSAMGPLMGLFDALDISAQRA